MFTSPIATVLPSERRRAAAVSVLSVVMHTAIIAAAVRATMQAREHASALVVDTTAVFIESPPRSMPRRGPPVIPAAVTIDGLPPITDVPAVISTSNLQVTFDPRTLGDATAAAAASPGVDPGTAAVVSSSFVQDKPELLAGAPPAYPPLLRQARIEGRVLLRFIVDTAGRVEPASMQVVYSDNAGFDRAAEDYARRALFRPGRQFGRAVRVLVELPIDFRLTR